MTTKSATATIQKPQMNEPAARTEHTNLSYRYGTIGIEAVAAAARYTTSRKQPGEAHAAQRIDLRFVESAG